MSSSYTTHRRVEFRDTDAAGIMHFSVFFTYMEEVEHEFLRAINLSVVQQHGEKTVSWPRVSAHCDYRQAVHFEQEMEIELVIQRLGNKSVTYGFVFRCDGDLIAEGSVTAVCCVMQPPAKPRSIAIPGEIAHQLQPYVRP